MTAPYVLTECEWLVPVDRVCFGNVNVPKKYCQRCLIFHEKNQGQFYAKYPTKTISKRATLKMQPFGVTVKAT